MLVEHEYARCGAWAYLAALDVHHARVFGRCESTTGIAPFDRLVEQVMTRPPYNEARRVFWVVDNGSSHRGAASVARLQNKFRRLTLVHGPVHASWLNQIEIYFSIIQRKVLSPNDFSGLQTLAERLESDLAATSQRQQIYMPVIFPGFSWHNLNRTAPQNQIPRQRGEFLRRLAE
jgi:hypothetical protein